MRTWMRRGGVWAATLALLALGAGGLEAQQRRGMGQGSPQDRAQLEQRVRARFAEMIKERLGLDDAEGRRLGEVMEGFHRDRQSLFQEEQALRRRSQELLRDGGASDEEAGEVLSRMQALREEEVRLFQAEQAALLEILTPVQLVRLHAMREQLSQRVQQLRVGPPGAARRPPGGGGPGGILRPA